MQISRSVDIQDVVREAKTKHVNSEDSLQYTISKILREKYGMDNTDAYMISGRAEKDRNYHYEISISNQRPTEQPQSNIPKCPTCSSTKIHKIGAVGRMASVGLFGLAGGSIGKTFECGNCGYKW
jgi:hypothetical protein